MYEMKERIRYSEVGYDGKLTLSGLVNYFQDCSTFQTEDLGLTIQYYKELNQIWLLSSWQVEINRMPELCEEIIIGTFPYAFKGFMGMRNYYMNSLQGEQLACANTVWTLIDMQSRHPLRVTQEAIRGFILEEKLDMEYVPRKIKLEGTRSSRQKIRIGKERIDTNGHMNNGQYVCLAAEYLEEQAKIRRLRVEYKKEVRYQDEIMPVVYENGAVVQVALEDAEGAVVAVVEAVYES